jgi:hypothetical protein
MNIDEARNFSTAVLSKYVGKNMRSRHYQMAFVQDFAFIIDSLRQRGIVIHDPVCGVIVGIEFDHNQPIRVYG